MITEKECPVFRWWLRGAGVPAELDGWDACGARDVGSWMRGRNALAAVVKIPFPQGGSLHQKCARISFKDFQSNLELAQSITVVQFLASRPVSVCYAVTPELGSNKHPCWRPLPAKRSLCIYVLVVDVFTRKCLLAMERVGKFKP